MVKPKETLLHEQYLTTEEVQEFKALVKETMGVELSHEQALDQGSRLVMLFETMLKFKPIPLSYKDPVDNRGKKNKNGHK